MTEEEAKTKWCPFVRAGGNNSPSFNRWNTGAAVGSGSPALCIASECMAWRWIDLGKPSTVQRQETGTITPRVRVRPPEGEGWVAVKAGHDRESPGRYRWKIWEREIPAVLGTGYCGLAGAPQ